MDSRESVYELISAANGGDEAAAESVIKDNMALVRSIARRYAGRVESEDLVQIGSLGLLKAVRRFDTSLGVCFSTYAVPLIAGEIKRFLRDTGAVKVSRRLKELAARANAQIARIEAEEGRQASLEELAALLSAEPADVAAALTAAAPCRSIDEPISDDGTTAGELLADPVGMEAESIEHLMLCELLSRLGPGERRLIGLRYFECRSQAETGRLLGLSQPQVSRLENRIIAALRQSAGE